MGSRLSTAADGRGAGGKKEDSPSSYPRIFVPQPTLHIDMVRTSNSFSDDWQITDKLGLASLGRGRFALLFQCASKHVPGLKATVKIVNAELLKVDTVRARLRDHVEALERLDHPHICTLFGLYSGSLGVHPKYQGSAEDMLVVEELCEGGELFDKLASTTSFRESDACELVWRMLDAIAYAHSKGILHRDINPQNVLLASADNSYDVRIANWGLALDSQDSTQVPVITDPGFMSPEVLDLAVLDPSPGYSDKSDVWSIGILAYILLSGHHPFDAYAVHQQVAAVRRCKLDFPEDLFKGISDRAKAFLTCVLVRDPSARPSARSLLEHPWFVADPPPLHKVASVSSVVFPSPTPTPANSMVGNSLLKSPSEMSFLAEAERRKKADGDALGPELHTRLKDLQERRRASFRAAARAVMVANRWAHLGEGEGAGFSPRESPKVFKSPGTV